MSSAQVVDLRKGFRVEVEAMVMPQGEFGARLYTANGRYKDSKRIRWKQAGPIVVAATPEQAARDLLAAMNEGLLKGVEAKG